MRDLEAAGNPYAGQYSDFDRWSYAHYLDPQSQQFREIFMTKNPTVVDYFYVDVNEDGYVVPMATQLEWLLNPPADKEQSPCQYSFYCAGELDPQLKDWIRETGLAHLAKAAPPVPQWLADDPPLWVSPVSNGEYLTLGRLGSGSDCQVDLSIEQMYNMMPHVEHDVGDAKYCRYSADGALIAEAEPGQEWWRLFFTDIDNVAAELSHGLDYEVRQYRGTIVVYEKTSWTPLGTYDFLGNQIDTEGQKFGAQNLLHWIYGGNLKAIYDKQQVAGGSPDATLADAAQT